jgi:hypothetical protein
MEKLLNWKIKLIQFHEFWRFIAFMKLSMAMCNQLKDACLNFSINYDTLLCF